MNGRAGSPDRSWYLGVLPMLALFLIYLPDLGHGFVKDDFAWILTSRVEHPSGLLRLFHEARGFYRPLVSLSFAMNHAVLGLPPFWSGVTNFVLLLFCQAGIYALGRSLGMPRGAAVIAAILWSLNMHGINMAVLWISGRTSLMLTGFACFSAAAFFSGRLVVGGLLLLCALFSKEEAVLLPIVILAGSASALRRPMSPPPGWGALTSSIVLPLAAYLALRFSTDAMLPGSTPWYYRPSSDPALIARNAFEYLDRGVTFFAVVVVVTIILSHQWRLSETSTRLRVFGATWFAAGYGLTLFLPVRSSLYACFPSVGPALIAGGAISGASTAAQGVRRRLTLTVLAMLPLLLWPVYHARNRRWVEIADLSTTVLADLRSSGELVPGAKLVLDDDRTTRVNLAATFGPDLNDAVAVLGAPGITTWVVPPIEDAKPPPDPSVVTARFALRSGRLVRYTKPTMDPKTTK